jgi:hypothetical protein
LTGVLILIPRTTRLSFHPARKYGSPFSCIIPTVMHIALKRTAFAIRHLLSLVAVGDLSANNILPTMWDIFAIIVAVDMY